MRKSYKKPRNEKARKQIRRKLGIRQKVSGSLEAPRICVNKTNKHLRVQVIDDTESKTLFSVATYGKSAVGSVKADGAVAVGKAVGEKLKDLGKKTAVFDRNGRKYTGIIAKVADSIREQGIQF